MDSSNPAEVKRWAVRFGITPTQLMNAIECLGEEVADLMRLLDLQNPTPPEVAAYQAIQEPPERLLDYLDELVRLIEQEKARRFLIDTVFGQRNLALASRRPTRSLPKASPPRPFQLSIVFTSSIPGAKTIQLFNPKHKSAA